MKLRPMLDDLTSGYIQRAADRYPKQGDREPWINPQDYAKDKKMFRKAPVDDGVMTFTRAGLHQGSDQRCNDARITSRV
jgi:hypothetical protein